MSLNSTRRRKSWKFHLFLHSRTQFLASELRTNVCAVCVCLPTMRNDEDYAPGEPLFCTYRSTESSLTQCTTANVYDIPKWNFSWKFEWKFISHSLSSIALRVCGVYLGVNASRHHSTPNHPTNRAITMAKPSKYYNILMTTTMTTRDERIFPCEMYIALTYNAASQHRWL